MEYSSKYGKRDLSVCIIIPTYNEAHNIKKLLNQIFTNEKSQTGNDSISVLVVDDNSPDGTAEIVQKYMKQNAQVHILSRVQKEGLGAAYIAGMQHAMNNLNPDVIMEMDADFSHDPKSIFDLLARIHEGADFVIGSRYIKGGSIPEDWSMHRRLISKAANNYTKIVLRIPRVKDCSGGFRAIRSSLLRRINLPSLKVKGYGFQVILLEAALRKGAIVRETPINFHERNAGNSKMQLKDMVEGAVVILQTAIQNLFSKETEPVQSYHLPPTRALNNIKDNTGGSAEHTKSDPVKSN